MNERGEPGHKGSEEPLLKHAKRLFDETVLELDAATLSRLNRSRHLALAETAAPGPPVRWLTVAPAAAAIAAAVVAWHLTGDVDELPAATASDFELLLAGEELEMLQELEFYRWMALAGLENEPAPDDHVG